MPGKLSWRLGHLCASIGRSERLGLRGKLRKMAQSAESPQPPADSAGAVDRCGDPEQRNSATVLNRLLAAATSVCYGHSGSRRDLPLDSMDHMSKYGSRSHRPSAPLRRGLCRNRRRTLRASSAGFRSLLAGTATLGQWRAGTGPLKHLRVGSHVGRISA